MSRATMSTPRAAVLCVVSLDVPRSLNQPRVSQRGLFRARGPVHCPWGPRSGPKRPVTGRWETSPIPHPVHPTPLM